MYEIVPSNILLVEHHDNILLRMLVCMYSTCTIFSMQAVQRIVHCAYSSMY